MGERERTFQEEMERVYGKKKGKKPPPPTITSKGIVERTDILNLIRKQIEESRKNS